MEWGEGGQLPATFRSNAVGGLHGKAAPGGRGGEGQQPEASVPSPQASGEKPYQEVKREVGRGHPSILPSPTLLWLPAGELGLHILDPPSGARGRTAGEVHLVMILNFLFGFCPGALGYANADDGFSSSLLLLFLGLFAFLVVVKWCGAEPGEN